GGKTSYLLSRVRVVDDHRLGSISCSDEQAVMGMIDRHIAALPPGRPGIQHLMIDGVKHIDSAQLPHRGENSMLCGIQENLTGMRFYDEVPEQLIASSIQDSHAT